MIPFLRTLAYRFFEPIWSVDVRFNHRIRPLCWIIKKVYAPIWNGDWLPYRPFGEAVDD